MIRLTGPRSLADDYMSHDHQHLRFPRSSVRICHSTIGLEVPSCVTILPSTHVAVSWKLNLRLDQMWTSRRFSKCGKPSSQTLADVSCVGRLSTLWQAKQLYFYCDGTHSQFRPRKSRKVPCLEFVPESAPCGLAHPVACTRRDFVTRYTSTCIVAICLA